MAREMSRGYHGSELLAKKLGRLPILGETKEVDNLSFQIADGRSNKGFELVD